MKTKSTLTGNSSLVISGFDNPPKDPFCLLNNWFKQSEYLNITEPYAATLSTNSHPLESNFGWEERTVFIRG